MKTKKLSYVFYPGHLGKNPVTELPGNRGIRWDAPVKLVEDRFARSLVDDGGFRLALELGAAPKAIGVTKKRLEAAIAAGELATATYHPREGADVDVVVLPYRTTAAALGRKLQAEHAAAEDTPDA